MTEHNPMHVEEVRVRTVKVLREMKCRPPVQGGNGKGPSVPQARLASALGGWEMEGIVGTGERGKGIPTHYKLDIVNRAHKICIEVDGFSHGTFKRKAQDKKKTDWLTRRGWTVVRFKNKEVMNDVDACVAAVCSILAAG